MSRQLRCGKILSAFFILLVIILSLVVLVSPQGSLVTYYSTSAFVPLSFVRGMNFNQGSAFLNQSTRVQIYDLIVNNPGINFRGICNSLTLPFGVVQYHVGVLMRAGLVSARRDGRNKRYFESKKFSSKEMKVISLLRHQTAGEILTILSKDQTVSHRNLAQRLEISSQALTWHMKRLKEMGLITSLIDEVNVKYLLDEATVATVKRCINVIK